MKGISWEEGEKILLKDPRFAAERQRTEPEFQALRNLILLRKKDKISQEALAKRVNMKQSHIARLESGEVNPTIKILKRYATGLGYALELNLVPIKTNKGNHSINLRD